MVNSSEELAFGEPLVQTQVLYLVASCLSYLASIKCEAGSLFRKGTVVDFVAVKTPRFNAWFWGTNGRNVSSVALVTGLPQFRKSKNLTLRWL